MSIIKTYNKYSSMDEARRDTVIPDRAASGIDDSAHGMPASAITEMAERFERMMPRIANSSASSQNRSLFEDSLPKGASWVPTQKSAQAFNTPQTGSRNFVSPQMPYAPEFASPDRQQYPVHRILANRYWRLFYKLDPVVGNCLDLYSDLPWSNFELTGDGVEGEIRQAYEQMCRETQILALLPYFVKEFLSVGEVVPHASFDDSKGIFTHVALHNPDQLEVIDAPFIKMEPILHFIPDDRLRSVLTSNDPSLRKLRDRMPQELLTRLNARENIPLSNINATFIPRKMHPYDTRGTSILSRMWRIFMYEDAVFNASIQTARRAAAPLKVAKLGNPSSGWIPPPEQEKRLIELLAQAEQDPQAWLVYHYGVAFETIGNNDRAMSITREWETIERVKLVALGISKSFMHGEVSYASASTGLQVFLQRLKSMRLFFEQKWLYPKFFKPIAEINGWTKPKPSEVSHRYRIKRSARELEAQNMYIIPKIVWDKSLDPQINGDLIQAMTALEGLGVKFSKTTKMAAVGHSFEEETKKIHRENKFEKAYLPDLQMASGGGKGKGSGGGLMGGGGSPPPTSMDNMDLEEGGPPAPPGESPPETPGASVQADGVKVKADGSPESVEDLDREPPKASSFRNLKSKIWVDDKYGNWDASEISDLMHQIDDGDSDSAFWFQIGETQPFKDATAAKDGEALFEVIDQYLQSQGYPDKDIFELREILQAEGLLAELARPSDGIQNLEKVLTDSMAEMSDEEFANKVSKLISKNKGNTKESTFLVGTDAKDSLNLIDDLDMTKYKK